MKVRDSGRVGSIWMFGGHSLKLETTASVDRSSVRSIPTRPELIEQHELESPDVVEIR
jgi:hypothetical protein